MISTSDQTVIRSSFVKKRKLHDDFNSTVSSTSSIWVERMMEWTPAIVMSTMNEFLPPVLSQMTVSEYLGDQLMMTVMDLSEQQMALDLTVIKSHGCCFILHRDDDDRIVTTVADSTRITLRLSYDPKTNDPICVWMIRQNKDNKKIYQTQFTSHENWLYHITNCFVFTCGGPDNLIISLSCLNDPNMSISLTNVPQLCKWWMKESYRFIYEMLQPAHVKWIQNLYCRCNNGNCERLVSSKLLCPQPLNIKELFSHVGRLACEPFEHYQAYPSAGVDFEEYRPEYHSEDEDGMNQPHPEPELDSNITFNPGLVYYTFSFGR